MTGSHDYGLDWPQKHDTVPIVYDKIPYTYPSLAQAQYQIPENHFKRRNNVG